MKKNLIFLFVGLLIGATLSAAIALPSKLYNSLTLLTRIIYMLETDYVDVLDEDKLVKGAIGGMLSALDPYTMYLPPAYYKELQSETSGKFGGVGMEVGSQNGILTVISPIEDTPAFHAGIKPGDRILKIDGKSTKSLGLGEAVRHLRGNPGTKITLTILREGSSGMHDVVIKREIINVRSVKSELLDQKYGYVRITAFQTDTTIELRKALEDLAKKSGGLKGLILDLRNNPGGLLEQAVAVSDTFLTSGVIVSTKGRTHPEEISRATDKDNTEANYPIILIVNKGSASASEIVSGALQDNKRAVVLGETSFGKGSVQTVIDLGKLGGLKMTIAKYYTPSGKSIHGIGIVPDYYVKNPEVKMNPESAPTTIKEADIQKDAALEYLKTQRVPLKWLAKISKSDREAGVKKLEE